MHNDDTPYSPDQLINILKKYEIIIVSRDINEEFKFYYGFSDEYLVSIVKTLAITDYQKSIIDADEGGLLHIFYKNIFNVPNNIDCYIKFAIRKNRKRVAVVSFHDRSYKDEKNK